MKISLNWLKEYVDIALPVAELANKLTMAGLEVEGIETIGGNWENVVVGQIIDINPHPNADRLTLPTVDLGNEQRTVVCGAPNLKIGDKIAFAHLGAQLIDGHSGRMFTLKSAKIRGVVSSGMVCSEKELGISDNYEGIMVLPPEVPVGTPLVNYLGDTVFNLEVTPNRPDCLSIIGIAREVVALTGQSLRLPEAQYAETESSIEEQVSVEIADPELCPRYCASLINGVKVGESPRWLQQRLLACGLRPINNIVDITNYVMLEYGQPLHAFDSTRISGNEIIVRRANEGESIVSLDGVERILSSDMLVIADTDRAVAIAGVMGGANSEVCPETTSILLEAANFNPASIHYTGRRLQLSSEACMRFERGISPELTIPALKHATQLIVQLAGGKSAKGLIDVYPGKKDQKPILLSTDKIKKVLGIEFSLDEILGALVSLGFKCKKDDSATKIWVTVPYWRTDIHLAVDLVEEVARIIGYEKIPSTMLSQPLPRQTSAPGLSLKKKVRQSLTGAGFQEIITLSLTSLQSLNRLLPKLHPLEPAPLRMANPMTADLEYLRPNLRVNLLAAFSSNRRHEDSGIRLFELSKVYIPRNNDLPDEPEVLCGILGGLRFMKSWRSGGELIDFYDAKGVVESLLNQIGVEADFVESDDESLRLGRQAAVIVGGTKFGVIGELHPSVLEAFEISEAVYLFEINLTALLSYTVGYKMFQPIPRFPAIVRDIALIVDDGILHQRVLDIIKSFPLVSQVTLFDVYSGEQVPKGKKSLAYKVTFQSPNRTLTDKEVNKVQQRILGKLSQELGIELRI